MAANIEYLRQLHHSCDFCREKFNLDLTRQSDGELTSLQRKCLAKMRPQTPKNGCSQQFEDMIQRISFFDVDVRELRHASRMCLLSKYILESLNKSGIETLDGITCLGAFESPQFPFDKIEFKLFSFEQLADVEDFQRFACGEDLPGTTVAVFYICLFEGEPGAKSQQRWQMPINPEPSSHESLAMARCWLESCVGEHKECEPSTAVMPRRLLALSDDALGTQVRLVLTNSDTKRIPYAALSYCWGGEQPLQLTTLTLQKYLNGIALTDLPATIRDAIRVTLGIGLNHIWVDAYTILQDDEDDKVSEIRRMSQVYSGATVTIAATRASSVHQGFLQERLEGKRAGFEIPCALTSGPGNCFLIPEDFETTSKDWFDLREPLDVRAWALQERALSPRILDYRATVTSWQCKRQIRNTKGKADAMWVDGRTSQDVRLTNSLVADFLTRHRDQAQRYTSELPLDESSSNWSMLIGEYTERLLTFPQDRVLAVSAILAVLEEKHEMRFVAGVPVNLFPFALVWRIVSPYIWPRTSPSIAPSWSWASVTGPIRHLRLLYPSNGALICAAVQSWSAVQSHESAPLGNFRSASLQVLGRLKPVHWRRARDHELVNIPHRRSDILSWAMAKADGKEATTPSHDYHPDEGQQEEFSSASRIPLSPGYQRHPPRRLFTSARLGTEELMIAKVYFDYFRPEFKQPIDLATKIDLFLLPVAIRSDHQYSMSRRVPITRYLYLQSTRTHAEWLKEKDNDNDNNLIEGDDGIPRCTVGLVLEMLKNGDYQRVGLFEHEFSSEPRMSGMSDAEYISAFWGQHEWFLSGEEKAINII